MDSGGAGFVYFLEGILRFLARCKSPHDRISAPSDPRKPCLRRASRRRKQILHGVHRRARDVRRCHACAMLLQTRGDSLIVAGDATDAQSAHPHGQTRSRPRHCGQIRHAHARQSRQHGAAAQRAGRGQTGKGVLRALRSCPGSDSSGSQENSARKSQFRARAIRACAICCSRSTSACRDRVFLFANDSNVALAARGSGQAYGQTRRSHSDARYGRRNRRTASNCVGA